MQQFIALKENKARDVSTMETILLPTELIIRDSSRRDKRK
jgi:hypothetical protein